MSAFDAWLDRVLPSEMILGRTAVPTFLVCGLTGVAFGAMTVITLIAARNANLWVAMGMVGVACGTFIGTSLVHQRVRGWDEHVHLRDNYAVLAVVSLLLWATGNPILLYLDALAVGLSVFMIFGRVGCTAAGCCYGVRSSVGIRYPRHACNDAERVRRFPVQLIEATAWIGVALAGVLVSLVGGVGQATGLTLVLSGITRICTDGLRVDARPHWWGISEARLLALLGIAGGVMLYQMPTEWTLNNLLFSGIGLSAAAMVYFGRRLWLSLPPPLPERLPQRAMEIGRAIARQYPGPASPLHEAQVQTFAIDDIRIGVSQEVDGPVLGVVLSVSRDASSGRLSAAEAQYVLGLVAAAIGSPAVEPAAMVERQHGVYLVQLTRQHRAPPGQVVDLPPDIPRRPSAQVPSSPDEASASDGAAPGSWRPSQPDRLLEEGYFSPLPHSEEQARP